MAETLVTSHPETSFEALLDAVLDVAYGAALNMTRNRAAAEDLVQESALLALRGFHSFMPGTNFKAWFLRILTNCFLSGLRRQRDEMELSELEEVPSLYVFKAARELGLDRQEFDPVHSAFGRLDSEAIAAALQALPDEFRVVATLYFMEDLRYQDIAAALDLPIGTVRSRLHRARRVLQKRLWQLAQDHGFVPAGSTPQEREE